MKLAGLLLLVAGWVIVVGALLLLAAAAPRAAFALAGIAVQMLGLVLTARSHRIFEVEDRLDTERG
jgi:hypothetical protein